LVVLVTAPLLAVLEAGANETSLTRATLKGTILIDVAQGHAD
jgi:hypothetical protein